MAMDRGRWRRCAAFGLGLLALSRCPVAPAAPPPGPAASSAAGSKLTTAYSNRRASSIRFNIPEDDARRYKQIQLWVTGDGGAKWSQVDTQPANSRQFNFKVPDDGDYFMAVRTVDTKGRLFPADVGEIEPNMRVIVDTKPPTITIDSRGRRGNLAMIGWEVVDEHLDLASLNLEYQAEGARDWARIPIRKPARLDQVRWDAGTAEAVKVKGTIADKAGNVRTATIVLPEGSPADRPPGAAADSLEPDEPPPIGGSFASRSSGGARSTMPAMPPIEGSEPANDGATGSFDPWAQAPPRRPATSSPAPAASEAAAGPPILVQSPKFNLQYAVDDAAPGGPAAVELYVTTDGGRTWFNRGEDPDRASPFPVDLGGEGTYGLKLVARSAANQGDRPPANGEPPSTIVEVDGSGPVVKLDPPKMVGTRLIVNWQANDPHPAARPVMISVKADAPDAKWQLITPAPIENTGHFAWVVPAGCPPKIHVRVDVRDSLGNLGGAETPETAAVLVDRSKPKGRILGLDNSNRDTSNPSARPLR